MMCHALDFDECHEASLVQEESILNPQILALAKRVTCTVDDRIKTTLTPVTVRIDLTDDQSFSKRLEILKGNPANPTSEAEDIEKFKECVKFGVNKMSNERRDKLIQLILSLESLKDVRELIEYLGNV